jgi:hypothetical protein
MEMRRLFFFFYRNYYIKVTYAASGIPSYNEPQKYSFTDSSLALHDSRNTNASQGKV